MTVTKDGGVMIIKTKDWQTYKAKGWNKKEEVEEKFRWQDILKKKGNVKVGKTDKQGNWHSVSTSDKKELEKLKSQGYEIVDEELEEDCGCGHGSDCGCPSDCDCGCNAVNTEKMNEGKDYRLLAQRDTMNLSKQATVDFVADLYKKLDKLNALESVEEFEGEELSEAWNEKLSIKALGEYRKVYNLMKRAGIDNRFIKRMDLKRMEGIDFAMKVNDPEDLISLTYHGLEHPEDLESERLSAQKEYLFKVDGKASFRIVDAIESKLSGAQN